eukprot:6431283-Pyramimonas_sp.AAC.1
METDRRPLRTDHNQLRSFRRGCDIWRRFRKVPTKGKIISAVLGALTPLEPPNENLKQRLRSVRSPTADHDLCSTHAREPERGHGRVLCDSYTILT